MIRFFLDSKKYSFSRLCNIAQYRFSTCIYSLAEEFSQPRKPSIAAQQQSR
ncbi:hypothetical protein OIU79_022482 [Salix purpurea]|uniref:Uncharacterized protein n=1 Tax=Salix purpurea TaxID=77065 RepID=A0A9Q0WJ06_SALPP|nr:hypothetical protein OIU79_022482 [Salix purpurea]